MSEVYLQNSLPRTASYASADILDMVNVVHVGLLYSVPIALSVLLGLVIGSTSRFHLKKLFIKDIPVPPEVIVKTSDWKMPKRNRMKLINLHDSLVNGGINGGANAICNEGGTITL